MLTVKVVSEDGVSIYQSDRIHYRIHPNEKLSDFETEEFNQVFIQCGGLVDYLNMNFIDPIKDDKLDFIEFHIHDKLILLIGRPANIFIMNENGKTVEKI